jgi:hypothetical protein
MRAPVGSVEVTAWRRIIEWPYFAYHIITWFVGMAALVAVIDVAALAQGSTFRAPLWLAVVVCLALGYAFEWWERRQELTHVGRELEHPVNRWLVDPLVSNMAGAALGWALVAGVRGVLS